MQKNPKKTNKTKQQQEKNASQFLKIIFACGKKKALLRSACLLRSEFQTI